MSNIIRNKEYRGPYLGFTYNGLHSSSFNIVRTSDGNRFNENLFPSIQDKSFQIPARDGKVLQNSNFDTRVFTVQYAYDKMTEKDRANLKLWLGDKKIHPLVFDELPYKTWYAKVTGSATAKWIPFDIDGIERVYKGEGTIQFTCYDPYAYCDFNFDYLRYFDREEWIEASRLLERDYYFSDENGAYSLKTWLDGEFQWDDKESGLYCKVFNCGDVDADFIITLKCEGLKNIPDFSIALVDAFGNRLGKIGFDKITMIGSDTEISVNSKIHLTEGMKSKNEITIKTNNIYDSHIVSGTYFKIPSGIPAFIKIKAKNSEDWEEIKRLNVKIKYYYKYL